MSSDEYRPEFTELTVREEAERRRQVAEDFDREFGRTIKRERTRRGWTADEAAKKAQVAPKTWKRLEDGKPVQSLTLSKVDRLFDLPEGTAFDAWSQRTDLQDALNRQQGLGRGLANLIPRAPVVDPSASLAQRIAGLSLEDLYRLRDMINGAIAVQEQDPATHALRDLHRKLDMLGKSIERARSRFDGTDELARVEETMAIIANGLRKIENHHINPSEIHSLLPHFKQMQDMLASLTKAVNDVGVD